MAVIIRLLFALLLRAMLVLGSGSSLELQDSALIALRLLPNISDDLCPTWFTPALIGNSTWCTCDGSKVQGGAVVRCPKRSRVCVQNCPLEVKYGRDELNVSIMTGFCMTHNFQTHQTLLALCPFDVFPERPIDDSYTTNSRSASGFFVTLPSNLSDLCYFVCRSYNYARKGDLCSHCVNGTEPSIQRGGLNCVIPTSSALHWFYFALCETLVPTVFFFSVLLSNVRIMHGPLNAFIFFCQVLSCLFTLQRESFANTLELYSHDAWNSTAEAARIVVMEGIGMFMMLWNAQFLWTITFSLTAHLSTIQIKALEYFPALYPFFLVILTILIIKLYNLFEGSVIVRSLKRPFAYCARKFRIRLQWDPSRSIIHTLATFILLSYSKTIVISFNLLAPSRVYNRSGELDYKIISYNASIHFLDHHHLPYAVLALCMLTIFCGLPFLVLLLYPMEWFHKLLDKLNVPFSITMYLKYFTEVYTGCYRDRTEPEKLERRYFAAFYLLFRIICFSSIYFVKYSYLWLVLILLSPTVSFLFAAFQPYKEKWLNISDSLAFLLAAVVVLLYTYSIYVAEIPLWLPNLFLVLPFLYFVVYVTYEIVRRCRRKFCPKNRGTVRLQETISYQEDDNDRHRPDHDERSPLLN